MSSQDERVPVAKTFKLYIDGGFPRTESGRYLQAEDDQGDFVANICRASRKDFRDSVVAAREALDDWSNRTAFNRGQILYRIAEVFEARRSDFENNLVKLEGYSEDEAQKEVDKAIDRTVFYAGWADKFNQIFGSVNPVASSHFNFTFPEPTGVVAIFAPQNSPVLGLVSSLLPVITGGNTAILIVDNEAPSLAIEFAEILNNSDVPGGTVNILTGLRDELTGHVAGHKDVDGVASYGPSEENKEQLQLEAAESLKRVDFFDDPDDPEAWLDESWESPYKIEPFVEYKTAWHPVGV
jgi:acyl-CoA reductase-like NAD-dependent aldehyde dehydrogenase